MKDRNYYRQCDDAQLLIEAKEGGNELALVLAERLKDTLTDLEQLASNPLAYLEDRVADLEEQLSEARAIIDTLEDELENAK